MAIELFRLAAKPCRQVSDVQAAIKHGQAVIKNVMGGSTHMKMTRWVSTAMALAFAGLLPSANPALAATTLQMGHPTASNSHYGVASATLADELARRSNGSGRPSIEVAWARARLSRPSCSAAAQASSRREP